MKTKLPKAKSKSAVGRVRQLFSRIACFGAIILICSSASARNLFMSDGYGGIEHNLGHIYKFTPLGVVSTFSLRIRWSGRFGVRRRRQFVCHISWPHL